MDLRTAINFQLPVGHTPKALPFSVFLIVYQCHSGPSATARSISVFSMLINVIWSVPLLEACNRFLQGCRPPPWACVRSK
jgi:hypothetical protein